MKRIRPILNRFWLLLFFILPAVVFAQDRIISGKVLDETNQPLIGASIKLKTGAAAASADVQGNFKIKAPQGAVTLIVSFIGYVNKEVNLLPETNTISIVLLPQENSLNEVVVIGYGTQKKKDVTGAVVSVKGETLREVPTASIQQALQGRAAGVEVQNVGTTPGANAQIRIRGERSINASNNPLIVLDGIPFGGNLNDINPGDIESVDILKDASSTAIYGSRGANGVILVTTKRGKLGETTVAYNAYYGQNNVINKYPVYNATQYQAMRDMATWPQDYMPDEKAGIAEGRNTDWQDLLYQSGYMTDNNLSITGGTEKNRFMAGAGLFRQTTVLPGQDFTRGTLKGSGDFKIGKSFKIGIANMSNFSITHGAQFGINVFPLLTLSPLSSPYNADGSINIKPAGNVDDKDGTYNPLLLLNNDDDWVDRIRRFRSFNSAFAEVDIWKGLKYRLNVGLDYSQEEGAQFRGTDTYFRPGLGNIASVRNSVATSYTLENLLTYDRVIASKHRVSATALYSIQEDKWHTTGVSKEGITSDFVQFYNLGLSSTDPAASLTGGETTATILSYMLRANYIYDDKYMITVTGRRDGSSRLGVGNKWKSYPAISTGWNISNESFMKKIDLVSNLKLRAGWGITSNQSVDAYSTLGGVSNLNSGLGAVIPIRYNFGTTSRTGFSVTKIVDPNLDWEYTRTANIGLDFGVFRNRITGAVEWYKTKTTKLLYGVSLPPTSGLTEPYLTNIGNVANRGMEFSISSENVKSNKGLNWSTDLNFFFNRNKLVKLNGAITQVINNQLFVGESLTAIWDYRKLGIWQLDEAEEAAKFGALPGQIKLEDNNGLGADGKLTGMPDGKLDVNDKTVIGDAQAKIQGGITNRFTYKSFDFSFVVYGRFGGKLISQIHQPQAGYVTMLDGRRNQLAVNYWTPTNPSNDFPSIAQPYVPAATSDAWTTLGYFDASFVKVRSINLGYNLKSAWAKHIKAKSIRVYATAQNPFILFSPYVKAGGIDPEPTGVGNQGISNPGNISGNRGLTIGLTTPSTRTFMFGLNASF
jgi:TonB-dependent starch-binding outer membrane protein SusC